jgi:hypothetical protein
VSSQVSEVVLKTVLTAAAIARDELVIDIIKQGNGHDSSCTGMRDDFNKTCHKSTFKGIMLKNLPVLKTV